MLQRQMIWRSEFQNHEKTGSLTFRVILCRGVFPPGPPHPAFPSQKRPSRPSLFCLQEGWQDSGCENQTDVLAELEKAFVCKWVSVEARGVQIIFSPVTY